MAIFDIFSHRNKPLPDVFQYEQLPLELRRQIVLILRDCTGSNKSRAALDYWEAIEAHLSRELGRFDLRTDGAPSDDAWIRCANFVLSASIEEVLSLVEMVFRTHGANQSPHVNSVRDAISEFNQRLRMHGVGYALEGQSIIRIASQLLHAEAVKPALRLLHDKRFKGAEREYLTAFDHFRKGKNEDALMWALKAFESVMKSICDICSIPYDSKDNAKNLIDKMFANQVIPSYMASQFTGLRSVLESGVPTIRNKSGGHGSGSIARQVPHHFAAYALHMAACNMVFLLECHTNKK